MLYQLNSRSTFLLYLRVALSHKFASSSKNIWKGYFFYLNQTQTHPRNLIPKNMQNTHSSRKFATTNFKNVILSVCRVFFKSQLRLRISRINKIVSFFNTIFQIKYKKNNIYIFTYIINHYLFKLYCKSSEEWYVDVHMLYI